MEKREMKYARDVQKNVSIYMLGLALMKGSWKQRRLGARLAINAMGSLLWVILVKVINALWILCARMQALCLGMSLEQDLELERVLVNLVEESSRQ